MADDAPDHPLDRLHPVGGPLLGLGIGLAPAAVIGAGYPLLGAGIGCGLAVAGLVGARRVEVSAPVEEAPALPVIPGWSAEREEPSSAPAPEVIPESEHRPALIAVAPGVHVIGSPEGEAGRLSWDMPRREVTLTRGYLIAETPVTQAQYAAVMGRNPSYFQGTPEDARRPVEQVSWLDTATYCNRLSELEGLKEAYVIKGTDVRWEDPEAGGYRLPTEAEWEVAARAGATTATYVGDLDILGQRNAPILDAIAWYGGNSGSAHPKALDSSGWEGKQHPHTQASTHPVKGKRPNAWGLYDMLGNVYEWTWDWYASTPPTAEADPSGPARGGWRVIRGGSFDDNAHRVRAAFRIWWSPGGRYWVLGFRPVRSTPRVRP